MANDDENTLYILILIQKKLFKNLIFIAYCDPPKITLYLCIIAKILFRKWDRPYVLINCRDQLMLCIFAYKQLGKFFCSDKYNGKLTPEWYWNYDGPYLTYTST